MLTETAQAISPAMIASDDILRALRSALAANPATTRRRIEQVIAVLASTAEPHTSDYGYPNGPHALAPWQSKRVAAYIDAHLGQRIAIQDLAAVSRLSVSYFFRAFRGSFGDAPHAFIVRRRVANAQLRLKEGDEPIAQVALSCGFSDQAHFSRVFARHLGCPPGAWRRRNRLIGSPEAA